MSAAEEVAPISPREAKALLAPLAHAAAVVLAISGGPDSTALLFLAARWRQALRNGPRLVAVTIDHGLRAQSAAEARRVKALATRLGISHRTLRWRNGKPSTGVQEAARAARYSLLARVAHSVRADYVVTAHTLDDQAETVLLRMAHGSGFVGLGAMAPMSPLPSAASLTSITLVRPFLDVPKARLLATLERAKIDWIDDPSNRDPRFTRTRLRELMRALAGEGLDARRLALLARRVRRADAAIEAAVEAAAGALAPQPWDDRAVMFPVEPFCGLPAEVALRLLGRAVAHVGKRPVRLGRLEALFETVDSAWAHPRRRASLHLRRTLGEALVTLTARTLRVERAPPRRSKGAGRPGPAKSRTSSWQGLLRHLDCTYGRT